MRNIIYSISLILISYLANAQVKQADLIGIWQAGSSELTSGWGDSYQFFSDGRFCFNVSQYDGTSRIKNFCGTYKLKNDTLTLTINQSKELQGGSIVRSETAGGSGWVIEGGKVITIAIKSSKKQQLTMKKSDSQNGVPCLLIDMHKYYRLDNDPTNYN